MRHLIVWLLVFGLASIGAAQESSPAPGLTAQAVTTPAGPAPGEAPYASARGLITGELAPGMFINPTSGTLRRFQVDLEYCALIYQNSVLNAGTGRVEDRTGVTHAAIAGFGVTDWLEVGAAGLVAVLPGDQDDARVAGPMARARLLKDEGWLPEVGVGAVFLFGDDARERYSAYVAASKGISLGDTGVVRSVRGHVGFRQTWVPHGDDGSFVYVGAEVGLPRYLFLVGEVSNKSGGLGKLPWAAGIQLRHPDGFGFTLAAVQNGNVKSPAIYVGVGINFQ